MQAAEVQLSAPETVTVGGTLPLEVRISQVTDLYAWQFDLQADAALTPNPPLTVGNFLTGNQHFIPGTLNANTLTGIAQTRLGPTPGLSGDGVLVQINLTATTPGTATLTLPNLRLLDSTGAVIPVPAPSRSVQVQAAAIPLLPGWGLLLLALGLVLLSLRSPQRYLLGLLLGLVILPAYGQDLNGDGVVDAADVALVEASFAARSGDPRYNAVADVNRDGGVDVHDLYIVAHAYGSRNANPVISSSPPTIAAVGIEYRYPVEAHDPDDDPLSYQLLSQPDGMTINPALGLIQWLPTRADPVTVTLQVSDGRGGLATQSYAITLDATVAVPELLGLSKPAALQALQASGLVPGTETRLQDATAPEGTILAQTPAPGTAVAAGSAVALTVSLGASDSLPPDPASIAPPVDPTVSTTIYDGTVFIYEDDRIQTGVAPGTIDIVRAAVLRGRVLDKQNNPLPGVTVTVRNHPEFGQTLSRADGYYDLVVNGGGYLSLDYAKADYLPAQRQADVPWQDYLVFDDVVLIPQDAQVTEISLEDPNTPMQVARGRPVSDADGSRQATLLIPQGTQAQVYNPDGTLTPVSQLTLRLTEYTVGDNGPQTMPGPLPPTSAYTYAVEIKAAEAAIKIAGKDVIFNQPVPFYLDNFLGFPVGIPVPTGYWNAEASAWVPEPDGVVIQVLTGVGGLAGVDSDGDGAADTAAQLAALGISDAERAQLAGLYPVGKTLWRVPLEHLSTCDLNFPAVPPPDEPPPDEPPPVPPDEPKPDKPDCENGSIIECQTQILGEALPLTGTPYSLHYSSGRAEGYVRQGNNTVFIPLTGDRIATGLRAVYLNIAIAGRWFTQIFPATPNQSYTFRWDGKDAYGRPVQGKQLLTISIVYDAPTYYAVPISRFDARAARSFALAGLVRDGLVYTRTYARAKRKTHLLGIGGLTTPATVLGAWSLNVQHHYDLFGRILYRGDGTRSSTQRPAGAVIATVAGVGVAGFDGDGNQALNALLHTPTHVVPASDGSYYIADTGNHRIRRVAPDGRISTVVGTGVAGFSGDGGSATQAQLALPTGIALAPDGSLYIADTNNQRIRRVAPDGRISTVAGTGIHGYSGDGGPATQAEISSPSYLALGPDGSLYIATSSRVRRIMPDGYIYTVAGTGVGGFSGDGGSATLAELGHLGGLALGPDGSLYIAGTQNHRVRRVAPSGIITTVVGNGRQGFDGDGGLAINAQLDNPHGLTLGSDGSLYVADYHNHRVRRIGPDGIITTVAGDGVPGFSGVASPAARARLDEPYGVAFGPDGSLYIADSNNHRIRRIAPNLPGLGRTAFQVASEDGEEVYQFDRRGKHLRTLDARTQAVTQQFAYDPEGFIAQVTDLSGNVTRFDRDLEFMTLGAIISPYGQHTTFTQDINSKRFTSVTNPAGERYQMSYTADGLLTQFTDPRGNASTFSYDDLGRLLTDQNAAGGSQTLSRTDLPLGIGLPQGYVSSRSTGMGRTARYQVEDLTTKTRRFVNTGYDGTQTTRLEHSDGRFQTHLPDGTQVTRTEGPDPRFGMQAPISNTLSILTGGLTTTGSHERTAVLADPNNPLSLVRLTDTAVLNGRTATSVYEAATRTETATSPAGRVSLGQLDALGRLIQAQDSDLAPVSLSYDARGRIASLTQGTGAETRRYALSYNAQGYLATLTDPLSRNYRFDYDAAGRVTRSTLPDGRSIGYAYDPSGNLTALTPPGRPAHQFDYTAVDLPETYAPPTVSGDPRTLYRYNLDKQLTQITRPGGELLTFNRDPAGRLTQLAMPHGTLGYSYDPATGKLIQITDPDGGTLSYGYTGALLAQVAWSGAVSGNVAYGYDNDFRVVSVSVNGANPVGYAYDPDSLLIQAGDLALTRNPTNGLLTQATLGKSNDHYSYNRFSELTDHEARLDSTALFRNEFSYDELGRITQKRETQAGVTHTYTYSYDLAGRLTEVQRDGVLSSRYTYDSNGNRLSREQGGVITQGVYDAQDRLQSYGAASYSYTANGELASKTLGSQTTSYRYDVLGNLRQVALPDGRTLDYVIDASNRRIGKRVNGGLVQGFLYQGQLRPAAELDASGAVVSRFVYATQANVPDYLVKAGVTYRIITDYLGSVRLVVDTTTGAIVQQLAYDVFGAVTLDTNPGFQPFGFAGGLYDRDTGLVRFGARDYDPDTARWTIKDPIGFAGGDSNLYGYVLGDPVNGLDVAGLECGGGDSGPNDVEPIYPVDILGYVPDFVPRLDDVQRIVVAAGRLGAFRDAAKLLRGFFTRNAARFSRDQLDKKFKHASDFGIDTTKKNSSTLKQFETAIQGHLEDAATIEKGTYGFIKGSKVFFNPNTNNVVILDGSNNFVTGFKLVPGTPQFQNYMTNGLLR